MNEELITNEQETKAIMNFIAHCNHYITGKYLFGANKLKEIHNDIVQSDQLTELINQCLEGFNVSLFKTKCLIKLPTKKGTFTSPTEKEDFIALAYTMIDEINCEKVDYDYFINRYFMSDKDENKFANQVIIPLRNIVCKLFSLPEDNENEFEITENYKTNEIVKDYTEAVAVAKNIISNISQKAFPTEDEKNAVIICFELIKSLQNSDFNQVLCFEIALTYISKYITEINYLFQELFFCLDQII